MFHNWVWQKGATIREGFYRPFHVAKLNERRSEDSLQFLLVLPDICEYHHSIWCLFKQHILVAFFSLITYKSNNTKRGLSHVSSYYLPSFPFDSTDSTKASLKWWKEGKPKWPPSQQFKIKNRLLLRLDPLPLLAAGARRHPVNDHWWDLWDKILISWKSQLLLYLANDNSNDQRWKSYDQW